MAVYKQSDSGPPVRDIQDRLAALDFGSGDDEPGTFGPGTVDAVRSFQQDRNLTPDGKVGRETWRTLVDAGFRLGDRMLYHTFPMFHGDDVATLQRQLSAIGFDAGHIDGIFGADTLAAVLEFQENRRLPEDGIAGPLLISELDLIERETAKLGRDRVRDRVWLMARPASLAGQRVFVDPFCRSEREAVAAWEAALGAARRLRSIGSQVLVSRSADSTPAERMRARLANDQAVDLILSFAIPDVDGPGVFFFASSLTHSDAGEAVATEIAGHLGLRAIGRVMPILRETRATSVVVTVPNLDASLGALVARIVEAWLGAEPTGT